MLSITSVLAYTLIHHALGGRLSCYPSLTAKLPDPYLPEDGVFKNWQPCSLMTGISYYSPDTCG